MLRAVGVEDLVIEEDAPPPLLRGERRLGLLFGEQGGGARRRPIPGEGGEDGVEIVEVRGLVEGDADAPALLPAQVDAPRFGGGQDPRRLVVFGLRREGVEDRLGTRGVAELPRAPRGARG